MPLQDRRGHHGRHRPFEGGPDGLGLGRSGANDKRALAIRNDVMIYWLSWCCSASSVFDLALLGAGERMLPFQVKAADKAQPHRLHHPPRGRVHRHGLRPDALQAEFAKALGQEGAGAFARIPTAPDGGTQAVTELALAGRPIARAFSRAKPPMNVFDAFSTAIQQRGAFPSRGMNRGSTSVSIAARVAGAAVR